MNLIRSLNNWRRYRTTYNQLSRLSDRELSDVGLTRFDIDRIARQGA
jgi:YD repeat-containing protein